MSGKSQQAESSSNSIRYAVLLRRFCIIYTTGGQIGAKKTHIAHSHARRNEEYPLHTFMPVPRWSIYPEILHRFVHNTKIPSSPRRAPSAQMVCHRHRRKLFQTHECSYLCLSFRMSSDIDGQLFSNAKAHAVNSQESRMTRESAPPPSRS